MREESVGERR